MMGSLSALHVIIWKFALIAFTKVETEGVKFKPKDVWWDAVARLEVRLRAYGEGVRRWMMRREGLGDCGPMPPAVLARHSDVVKPLAEMSEDGKLTWHPALSALLARRSHRAEKRCVAAAGRRRARERARAQAT